MFSFREEAGVILSKAMTRLGLMAAAIALVLTLGLATAGSASAKEQLVMTTGKGLTVGHVTTDNTGLVAEKGGPASSIGITTPQLEHQAFASVVSTAAIGPKSQPMAFDAADDGFGVKFFASTNERVMDAGTVNPVHFNMGTGLRASPAPRLDQLRMVNGTDVEVVFWIGGSSYFGPHYGFAMANPRTSGKCVMICPASAFVVGVLHPSAIVANNTILGTPAGVIVATNLNWTTSKAAGYNPAAYMERQRSSISSVSSPSSSNLDPTTFSASDGFEANSSVAIRAGNTNEPKSGNAGLLGSDGGNGGLWLLLGFAAVAGAAVAGRQLYGRRED